MRPKRLAALEERLFEILHKYTAPAQPGPKQPA
jgi:hypothetical protein